MKLYIGGSLFKTKKIAKSHIRSVLRPLVGREVCKESEHFTLIEGLWQRSPMHRPGVTHFEIVEKLGGIGVRAIICDDDESSHYVDFSIRESISGHSVSYWQKLTSALRGSIRPQIREFKAASEKRCALCGSSGWLEADHEIRFRDLMRSFIAGRETPREFAYCADGFKFHDWDLSFQSEWLAYHQENAKLRLLCSPCHASHTKAQRECSESEDSQDAF